MARGGKRPGAGRKSRLEELGITEKMTSIMGTDIVFKKLSELVIDGEFQAIKLWLEYAIGKPVKEVDITADVVTEVKKIILKD